MPRRRPSRPRPAAARPHPRRDRAVPGARVGRDPGAAPGPGGARLAARRRRSSRSPTRIGFTPALLPRRWRRSTTCSSWSRSARTWSACAPTSSCALVGAGDDPARVRAGARHPRRRDHRGRHVHAAHRRVLRRLRLGAGRLGRRALPRAVRPPTSVPRADRPAAARRHGGERPRILLDFEGDRRDIADYEAAGGYASLPRRAGDGADGRSSARSTLGPARPRRRRLPDRPQGVVPAQGPQAGYLCVNADESEPGTFKDREIMLRNPHALIEGILIMSYAIGATSAFIYIRGEYRTEFEVLMRAIAQARAAGYVGRNVLRRRLRRDDRAAPRRRRLHLRRGDGAAVLAQGRARPAPPKPPFPAVAGLYAAPDAAQQRRDASPPCRTSSRWAPRGTPRSAPSGRRARASSRCPATCKRPGNYELPLTADAARPDRGPRRRRAGRPDA